MKNLTPTLENCTDLDRTAKEHGVELPATYFWWDTHSINLFTKHNGQPFHSKDIIPAPTAGELGEWLPKVVDGYYIKIHYMMGLRAWRVHYIKPKGSDGFHTDASTLEDSACLMMEHLIAEGLITKI